jgi:hypothetical protein
MNTLNYKLIKTNQSFINPARVDYWKVKIDAKEAVMVNIHLSNGIYYVIDGNHRLKAFIALNFKDIPVKILNNKELTKYIFRR